MEKTEFEQMRDKAGKFGDTDHRNSEIQDISFR